MGNICGKESKSESNLFAQPGRTLGLTPLDNTRTARVPDNVGGPPRTGRVLSHSNTTSSTTNLDSQDAKRKAAEAAEARAATLSQQSKGKKLATQLQQQKKQTHAAVLNSVSRDELKHRALDKSLETLKY